MAIIHRIILIISLICLVCGIALSSTFFVKLLEVMSEIGPIEIDPKCNLVYDGSCVSECPQHTVQNENGECTPKPCEVNKTRLNGQERCVCENYFNDSCVANCPENWEADPDSRVCVESDPVVQPLCPENEIAFDNECICVRKMGNRCVSECPKGFEATEGDRVCRQCPITINTQDQKKKCIEACPTMMELINGECQNCSLIHKNHCVDTCPTGYEATNGNRKCQECALIHNKQCVQECPDDTERNGKVCVDKSPSVVVLPVCGENMTIRKGKCACMLQMNDECVEKCPVGWVANDNYQCTERCPDGTEAEGKNCKTDNSSLTTDNSMSSGIFLGVFVFIVLVSLVAAIFAANRKNTKAKLIQNSALKDSGKSAESEEKVIMLHSI